MAHRSLYSSNVVKPVVFGNLMSLSFKLVVWALSVMSDEPWGYQIDDGRRWHFFMTVDDIGVKMVGRRDGKSRY